MPLRRVNAQYVSTGFEQCRDPLLIVTGVDSRANNIAFVIVQQFIGVLLMALIVLAEDKTAQTPVLRENGERVELMLPDNVVGFFERRALTCPDEFFKRRHECGNRRVKIHTAHAVITAGNNTHELSVGGPVFRNGYSGMPGLLLECKYITQCIIGVEVRVALNEACLIALGTANHCCFVFHTLRTVDKGNTALGSKCDSHAIAGDGLHNGRYHGDVHADRAFLLALSELYKRGPERNLVGTAGDGSIAGDQQILVKRMARFIDNSRHNLSPFLFQLALVSQ